jgi:hypothetical protein
MSSQKASSASTNPSALFCIESRTLSYLGEFHADVEPTADAPALVRLLDEHDVAKKYGEDARQQASEPNKRRVGTYAVGDQVSLHDFVL